MITARPYRASMSEENAVAELGRASGTQFDPAVLAALLQVLIARGASAGAVPA